MIVEIDGVETEVFTEAEIAGKQAAAIEEFKAENPDKTAELEALQEELKAANEKAEKLVNKDMNFSNLRQQKEDAEKKAKDLAKEIDEKIAGVKKEVLEGVMQDHYADTVKALVGDDVELKKKLEFQYKRLGDAASTKEEVTKKLTDAYFLATKTEGVNALNSTVLSSGGVSKLNINKSNTKMSPDEEALLNKMAQAGGMKITKEDIAKYGN